LRGVFFVFLAAFIEISSSFFVHFLAGRRVGATLIWSRPESVLDFLPAPMKCLCCQQVFQCAPFNLGRQKFCDKPACRLASKRASQRRWLSKSENKDHFRGGANVQRVQEWRKANPGYWRRRPKKAPDALQDFAPGQTPVIQSVAESDPLELFRGTLQDIAQVQVPLLVGIISQFVDSPLQDDIVGYVRRMVARGQDLLDLPSRRSLNQKTPYDTQKAPPSGSAPPGAVPVQLGRSPSRSTTPARPL